MPITLRALRATMTKESTLFNGDESAEVESEVSAVVLVLRVSACYMQKSAFRVMNSRMAMMARINVDCSDRRRRRGVALGLLSLMSLEVLDGMGTILGPCIDRHIIAVMTVANRTLSAVAILRLSLLPEVGRVRKLLTEVFKGWARTQVT